MVAITEQKLTLDKLKEYTFEALALYEEGQRPDGVSQEIDRLIIDCVQLRACYEAVDKIISEEHESSLLFKSFLIGTVYSVGLKIRKIFDKQKQTNSLKNVWEQWYKHEEGRQALVNISSKSEVEFIWSVFNQPDKSKYKKGWGYLQRVLSHNQTSMNNIQWADFDELICFSVRAWTILVNSTDNYYGFGAFKQWEQVNKSISSLVTDEQYQRMKDRYNTFCSDAEHWKHDSVENYM